MSIKIANGDDTEITEPEIVRNGPHIPKGAKRPQDRKPPKKTAAQREAEGAETAEIEWREFVFTVVADPDRWKVSTTLAFEKNLFASGVEGLLGPEQFAEFMTIDPENHEMADLFKTLAEGLGLKK